MKKLLRKLQAVFYKPFVKMYLSKPRPYKYEGQRLIIPPGIFHPGFFYSTQFLLSELKKENLSGKKLLELGCGSGIISLFSAKRGADVTATDINQEAVESLWKNAELNRVLNIKIYKSDLFDNIPQQKFDRIIINPPYYMKDPVEPADFAWYCGSGGEYFIRLFRTLPDLINENSICWMVLSDQCDISFINQEASKNKLKLIEIKRKKMLTEVNFIFRIILAQL